MKMLRYYFLIAMLALAGQFSFAQSKVAVYEWWTGQQQNTSVLTTSWTWLRADSYSGSSPTIELTDLSGNGRTMTQVAGTITTGTATNGQARMTGIATTRFTSSATLPSWPVTTFTIAKRTAGATCGFFGHTGATGYNGLWYGYETVDRFAVYNSNATLNTTSEAGTTACYAMRIGHGSRVSILNGIIQPLMGRSTLVGPASATTVSLGTEYRGLNLEWQETIVFDRLLSLAEIDEVHAYFNARYGMSIPLWSSYTAAPTICIYGQSNAAGRGDRGTSDANVPAEYDAALTGVNIWYGTRTLNIGSAFETLNINNNNHMLGDEVQAPTYFGPELTLGKEYIDRVGGSVYIHKYATGGTNLAYSASLGYWHPTVYTTRAHNSQNRLFGQAMENWWQSLRVHQAAGRRPEVKVIDYFQGEQDATTLADANNYSLNGVELFNNFESEMGVGTGLKKLICRIHTNGSETYESIVRSEQATLVTLLTNAVLVDSDPYATRAGDGVHLAAQGQLDIGAFKALLAP